MSSKISLIKKFFNNIIPKSYLILFITVTSVYYYKHSTFKIIYYCNRIYKLIRIVKICTNIIFGARIIDYAFFLGEVLLNVDRRCFCFVACPPPSLPLLCGSVKNNYKKTLTIVVLK